MTLSLGLELTKSGITTDLLYTVLFTLLGHGGMFIVKRPGTGKILSAISRFGSVQIDMIDPSLEFSDEFGTDVDGNVANFREIWVRVIHDLLWDTLYRSRFTPTIDAFKNSVFHQLLQNLISII